MLLTKSQTKHRLHCIYCQTTTGLKYNPVGNSHHNLIQALLFIFYHKFYSQFTTLSLTVLRSSFCLQCEPIDLEMHLSYL